MNEQTVAVLSRRAAASMSRRGSFLSLGGALAAAVAVPSLAQAEKSSKRAKKAKKRRAQQRAAERAENEATQICLNQDAQCRAHVLKVCQGEGGFCIAAIECCSSFGACDVAGFFGCLAALA